MMENLTTREYQLVPAIEGGRSFKCGTCDRTLPTHYPFVTVERDLVARQPRIEGVIDAQCVYCDQTPLLPALDD